MSATLKPRLGLCQTCQTIKPLAVDRTNTVDGRTVVTRLCWICLRKRVTP